MYKENLLQLPLIELVSQADKTREKFAGNKIEICSIINAKSGLCAEDCRFCAQSSHYFTNSPVFPLKTKKEIVESACRAKEAGAKRFGIVTSGNRLSSREIDIIADTIEEIKKGAGIKPCASLGALTKEELKDLRQAGLERYHHNIESSPHFYPGIVSTHSFKQRIKTITFAKEAGLQVCSGGIIGMGESWQDRIDMAHLLKRLEVDSVPINILMPVKGTPFVSLEALSCADIIKTIAIFRLIIKDKVIKIAAGRETLFKDFQGMGFMAGANGMLVGGYLTVKGRSIEDDFRFIKEIRKIWKA